MTSGSEVMSRKKVNTPWSIYRDFTVFYFKTVFSSYKTARISVHIRPLFIWIESLLIGCVSYISKVKINNVRLDMFDNMSSE